MLLAIDVGNTHTVYGVWNGQECLATWRRHTSYDDTEDELAVWLKGLFDLSGLAFKVDGAICGTVVPQMRRALSSMAEKWLHCPLRFLENGAAVGMKVDYLPPNAVGADRIANALGALDRWAPPVVIVDFGTATTFDAVNADGAYVGGAILPGIEVSTQALVSHTAKLPQIDFRAPNSAIGKTTAESLQSGIILGYAGAIDRLARLTSNELGGAKIVATGGLGSMFLDLCETIELYDPVLTLNGLRLAYERLT
jgi:type III pantothenate kinase